MKEFLERNEKIILILITIALVLIFCYIVSKIDYPYEPITIEDITDSPPSHTIGSENSQSDLKY